MYLWDFYVSSAGLATEGGEEEEQILMLAKNNVVQHILLHTTLSLSSFAQIVTF